MVDAHHAAIPHQQKTCTALKQLHVKYKYLAVNNKDQISAKAFFIIFTYAYHNQY